MCRFLRIRQRFTRPYTPQTNGKAERLIQTALREWAYTFASTKSTERGQHLPRWRHNYNWHRQHGSLNHKAPISTLGLSGDKFMRLHSKAKRMSKAEKRLLKRRQAVEPSIGHLKADHRMHRNFLKGVLGDAMNPILAAAGFNIRWLRRWLVFFLRWILPRVLRLLDQGGTDARSNVKPAAA